MKKADLQEFLNKFYLGGVLTKDAQDWMAIPIQVESNVAKVATKSGDGSLLSIIDFNLPIPDGEFVIGNTKQLLSILNAFDSELKVELKKVGQKYVNVLNISDENVSATVALADPSQIEERVSLKSEPFLDVTFPLKKEFVERFTKAKKALGDATMFAVIPDDMKNEIDFIVNHSPDNNVNTIKVIATGATITTEFEPLYFNVANAVAVFQENTEYREATVGFSAHGLMVVHFKGEDYEAKYYLKSYKRD